MEQATDLTLHDWPAIKLDAVIRKYPNLSEAEELELAKRVADSNDIEAVYTLTMSHMKLVNSLARGYHGYGLPHGDLVQEGSIGLMKAIKRFDYTRGVRLSCVATPWIKNSITEYVINNHSIIKMATTKQLRKMFFNLRSSRQDIDGKSLKPAEAKRIATEHHVRVEDVHEMVQRFQHVLSLDYSPAAEDDMNEHHAPSLRGTLVAEQDDPFSILASNYEHNDATAWMAEALQKIDDRSRAIIQARYLTDEPQTLHEVASQHNISYERVRQIEVAALKKMRATAPFETTPMVM